jgi:hypothetical protein
MRTSRLIPVAALLCAALGLITPAIEQPTGSDSGRIEQLTGLKGALNEKEGVFKVTLPRRDIQASVAGARMIPDLALTAWAAFPRAGDRAMVMGDVVLPENEVDPVMSAALDSGLEVTALHNHFLWGSPRVMFMHIGGMRDEAVLARAVQARRWDQRSQTLDQFQRREAQLLNRSGFLADCWGCAASICPCTRIGICWKSLLPLDHDFEILARQHQRAVARAVAAVQEG